MNIIDLKKREPEDMLVKQRLLLESLAFFRDVFNSISSVTIVLNDKRQLLFASNNFLDMLQLPSDKPLVGLRPGEVVACIHATESPYGCNNSSACSYCNALQAVLESQQQNKKITKESRITSLVNQKLLSWDLSVTSVPLAIKDERFYMVTLTDISSEKRKKQLERIFIHDLVNSVGGLSNMFYVLERSEEGKNKEQAMGIIKKTSQNLMEQVLAFKQVLHAENGDLEVKKTHFSSTDVIKEAIEIVLNNKRFSTPIVIDSSHKELEIYTDRILLSRILINMLINASEQEQDKGSAVFVAAREHENGVRFWVRNESIIPADVQAQIFQRSFSSKGEGRGLGTYSMKLLGENYLKGKVGFVSNPEDRTMFYVDLNQ